MLMGPIGAVGRVPDYLKFKIQYRHYPILMSIQKRIRVVQTAFCMRADDD